MSESKETDVQDQKADELAPGDLEKAVGRASDAYLNFGDTKGGENKP